MKTKCPVCNENYDNTTRICKYCYFPCVDKIFCSDKEKKKWIAEIVEPYQKNYYAILNAEKKYQRKIERLKQENEILKSQKQKELVAKNELDHSEIIKKSLLAKYQIGKKITVGQYEGKPIEWRILDLKGNKVLLISDSGLVHKPFHNTFNEVTWENCSLRKWLNNEFFQKSFSVEEKQRIELTDVIPQANPIKYFSAVSRTKHIELTDVIPQANPRYSGSLAKATKDRVFLLGVQEVKHYLKDDKSRICKTNTTMEKSCAWWLRMSGFNSKFAVVVMSDGSIYYYGHGVSIDSVAVRPALWMNLSS